MPPMQSGWSSGTTALPGSVLMIGLARRSAVASTSARAPSAPAPTSMTTLEPGVEHLGRRRDVLGAGQRPERGR